MTDVPDPQPSAPEGSVDALVEIVMAGLQSGYHAGGHHPNCATREDEGCDCYARGSAAARSALVALARKLEEAVELLAGIEEAWDVPPAYADCAREWFASLAALNPKEDA